MSSKKCSRTESQWAISSSVHGYTFLTNPPVAVGGKHLRHNDWEHVERRWGQSSLSLSVQMRDSPHCELLRKSVCHEGNLGSREHWKGFAVTGPALRQVDDSVWMTANRQEPLAVPQCSSFQEPPKSVPAAKFSANVVTLKDPPVSAWGEIPGSVSWQTTC